MFNKLLIVGSLSVFLLPVMSFAQSDGKTITHKSPVQVRQECGIAIPKIACWIDYGELKNNAYAQMFLGTSYEHGISVKKNVDQAFYWYEKSAKNKFPRGLYSLAEMYRKGLGTKQNRAKAYELHKEATMLGFEQSARSVGRMYAQEKPTSANQIHAYEWYYISTSTNRGSYKKERDAYGAHLTEEQRALGKQKALEIEKNIKH